MTYAQNALFLASFLSLSLNVFLLVKVKTAKKVRRGESIELQEFLGDLMGGVGIVSVSRVDPASILIRSVRQK